MCLPQVLAAAIGKAGAAGAASTSSMFTAELGIQLAQAALGYMGAMTAAQASASAAEATAKSAVNSANLQYFQENLRLKQEGEAASREAQQLAIDRKKAIGTAMASSDGAGMSLEGLLADYYNQEGRATSANEKQLDWAYTQGKYNKKGVASQAKDRINSAKASVQPGPSIFALGATVAGSALTTYQKYYPEG